MIHKPNNPGRPIVSACSCPTELISSYLDKIMAPIVRSLPSYVKDSQHELQIFREFNFLGEDKLSFTMDITSLYTVIPDGEGLLALKHFFDLRAVKEPSSETLLRLAELVLTLNCFSFADSYYKQISGVAMGTKMGTLGISGWGCATGTLEPLAYTRASSAEFCYSILK